LDNLMKDRGKQNSCRHVEYLFIYNVLGKHVYGQNIFLIDLIQYIDIITTNS